MLEEFPETPTFIPRRAAGGVAKALTGES